MSNPLRTASDNIRRQTNTKQIFNDRLIGDEEKFKLLSAIQAGDAVIEFYDLKDKKFVKEIEICKPFLIGVKMTCWTDQEQPYMHGVYSYNKTLSNLLNEHIKTEEIRLNAKDTEPYSSLYYENKCIGIQKQIKREIIKSVCNTKEQAILMTKLLYMLTREYGYRTMKVKTPFLQSEDSIDWRTSISPRFLKLEQKLIELGVNVKYLMYYDLITHHVQNQGNKKITQESVKLFLSKDLANLAKHLPRSATNVFDEPNASIYKQCAYLHKNGYYFSVMNDKFKNTTKKVLELLRVNSHVSAKQINERVRTDLDFNVQCFENNYKKVIATNSEVYTPIFVLSLIKKFTEKKELDLLRLIAPRFLESAMADKMVAQEVFHIIDSVVDELIQSPESARRKQSVRNHFYHCMSRLATVLPKRFFTKSFLEKLHELIAKTSSLKYELSEAEWFISEPLVRYVSTDIMEAIYQPRVWKRFRANDRKPYEHDAIDTNSYNINYSVKKIRQSDLIYSVAYQDFTAIKFNKICGNKPNFKKMASCLEEAINGLKSRKENYTNAFYRRPDPHLMILIKQLGSDSISLRDSYHEGYSIEQLEDLLKACNMKIFEEKYPSKGTATKRLKI